MTDFPKTSEGNSTGRGQNRDRLFVSDYVVEVEIGAFHTERHQTQRLRFTVIAELSSETAEQDDVDTISTYDRLTEAIDQELAVERFNLLETLAERIAANLFAEPNISALKIRIEKLDRIDGALGIEIERTRPETDSPAQSAATTVPVSVLFLSQEAQALDEEEWATRASEVEGALIICPDHAERSWQDMKAGPQKDRIALLSIEQAGWHLSALNPDLPTLASRTEIDWAIREGVSGIWSPSRMVLNATGDNLPNCSDGLAVARWLAVELGQVIFYSTQTGPDAAGQPDIESLKSPSDLTALPGGDDG